MYFYKLILLSEFFRKIHNDKLNGIVKDLLLSLL